MRIYRRGDTWWIAWGRERESTKTHDRKAAEIYARRRDRERADPAYASAHQASVATAVDRFLREIQTENIADGTRHMYRVKAGHVVRLLGSHRLSALAHEDVLAYTTAREEEGAATHTIHKELTTLRRALKSAARAGEFGKPPASVMPRYATGYKPSDRWVSLEEVWAVMHELDPGRAAWVAFTVATAANLGDVERALREDIGASSIRVRGTKTSARARTVPILSVFAALVAHVREHADGRPPRLFRPWANPWRDLGAAAVRAKVAPFGLHRLRHTTASTLVRAGVPLDLVAKIMGHSSSAMLERVYGHLSAGDVGKLIEARLGGVQITHKSPRPDSEKRKMH